MLVLMLIEKKLWHDIMNVVLKKFSKSDKKYDAVIDGGKSVSFGAKGYSDFTKNKDPQRKENYISRHKTSEDWGKSGVKSAGLFSRWILWEEPTVEKTVKKLNAKYKDIKITLK